MADPAADPDERVEDLLDAYEAAEEAGMPVTPETLCGSCPDLLPILRKRLAGLRAVAWLDSVTVLPTATGERHPGPGAWRAGEEPVPGYRLVRPLGRGGSGEVWEAVGPGGLPVALKGVPLAGRSAAAELRALDAVRGRRHPHLLALFGAWQTAGRLVIAAELADGSVWDRYRQVTANGQSGIPPGELLDYLREAAEGLDLLNSTAGAVAHRDVKPQNLLLVGGGVKVADFGLARAVAGDGTGHSGGMTVGFAPPEAFDGRTHKNGDQYSLAVTYCLLRGGRMPFAGPPAMLMKAHIHDPPDLSMLPPAEQPVLARALAKRPTDRWPDCGSFVAALEAAVPTTEIAPKQHDLSHPRHRRGRWLRAGAAFLAAVAVALAGGMRLWSGARNPGAVAGHHPASVVPGELLCLRGHTGTVSAVAFLADGKRALSGGFDRTVREWNLTTGAEVRQFRGHTGPVRSVTVSPDGATLLTAGGIDFRDLAVRVWDVATGAEVGRLEGHGHNVQHVAYHPDGRRAVTASMEGTARVWSVPERRELLRFEGLSSPDTTPSGWPRQVWGLAVSVDGGRAMCGLRDGSLRIFDVETGREVRRFMAHQGPANAVAIDQDWLITGSGEVWGGARFDNAGAVWSLPDLTRCGLLTAHPRGIRSVGTTRNGGLVLTGGVAGEVVVWSRIDNKVSTVYPGHEGGTWCVAVSPDQRTALTAGGDGFVRAWHLPMR